MIKTKSVQFLPPCLSGRQACASLPSRFTCRKAWQAGVIQTIYDIVKAQTMDAKSEKELETEFRIHCIFNY